MTPELIDQAAAKVGGRFRLSVLLQKRVRELVRGATPMVQTTGPISPPDLAIMEILEANLQFEDDGGEEMDILGLKAAKRAKAEE